LPSIPTKGSPTGIASGCSTRRSPG
jgi:hypothetical protein